MSFLSLLLAVTTLAQDSTPAPRVHARAPKRVSVSALAPLTAAAAALETAASALASAQVDVQVLTARAPVPAVSAAQLDVAAAVLEATAPALNDWDQDEPGQQDPADSAYRAARQALNRNEYNQAARQFRALRDRYPRSTHVANTYYWEAFALYRTGSDESLRAAREALRTQADRYPRATTRRDAEVLLRRINGVLARRGDAEASESTLVDATPPTPPTGPTPPAPPIIEGPRGRGPRDTDGSCDDEDDIRIAALNALLQMDADLAIPRLKTVLARRDAGSVCLRRKAVFIVSQKRSSETTAILLNAVRTDPDQEVREQAIFWLSQVPGDETVAALDSILRFSRDQGVQEKAIFALSQHRSPRAGAALRAFAERQDAPRELREQTIFWLGQQHSADNAAYLKTLYAKLDDDELKEKVIFSLSQMGGADNYRWLMDIALNQNENIEVRKKALFWAGQGRSVDVADLVRLYDSMKDREMREQLIFVYSQRREAAALDKLFDIGKNDPDRELRKKAIFWIGQSRDPRAAQFLQDLINQ